MNYKWPALKLISVSNALRIETNSGSESKVIESSVNFTRAILHVSLRVRIILITIAYL